MIPTANLATQLLQTATRHPDRPGLIRGDQVWTWAAIAARVRRAAAGLRAAGVRHGDRILVHGRNSPALFESMWAAWMLGAVWVPTNMRLTPPEIAYLAQSSAAAVHIFDHGFNDHAAAAAQANPAARLHLDLGPAWDALQTHAPLDHPADVDRDDPCWFFYTSGTTGRPKAGMLTHGQMAFVVLSHLNDLMPGATERDVSLVVAPLSHGAGIHAVAQVAAGAVSVLTESDRLDPAEAWRLVERHRVTNIFTVPTILTMLTRAPEVDQADHSSLRHVIYAGAPMYRADQQHALRKLGLVLVQYFGLGEVTGNITVLPPHLHSIEDDPAFPIGSCGRPRTGMDIAILAPDGARLGPHETGEICVRGPAVFAGYHNNPEANAKSFAHGWFHTGDLGHLDSRGFLFITGRASDMFISGGSNVYPREIEEALLQHPAIVEACIVGMPHPKWGESGVAVLVLHPGATATPADLRAHLEARLARYKHPADYQFWAELPKSGYGKVAKMEIKQRLEASGLVLTA
jgi:fatty-acyl-CoA synthase